MKKVFSIIGWLVAACFIALVVAVVVGVGEALKLPETRIDKPGLLHLDLEGVIADSKTFNQLLLDHIDKPEIKGVLVYVDSPGGVVGPSQELFAELVRVSKTLEKPVVAACSGLAASGAYYAIAGADQIFVNPGTLMGSIGVIMSMVNLQKLQEWAKIDFVTIKAGAFKDAGSPNRKMTPEEREWFQSLLDEVHDQFRRAIATHRKIPSDILNKYADGRIFNGEMGVKLGFADQLGTYEDARRYLGELTGLGTDPKVYRPKKQPENFWEMVGAPQSLGGFDLVKDQLPWAKLSGKPLFLLPHVVGQ